MRIGLLLAIGLVGGVWADPASFHNARDFAAASRPNIILLFADDLGYGDVDVNGTDMNPQSLLPPRSQGTTALA